MRTLGIVVIAISIAALAAPAQPPEKLDAVLRGWEKALVDMRTFVVAIQRINEDKALGVRDTYDGFAMIEKTPQNGGLRARFKLVKSTNKDLFEEFHYDNGKLFEFVPASKMVRQHLVPKEKFAGQQGSLLSLLFDMGIQQAKARYRLEVKDANPPDAHYDYIQIEPRQAADKSEFARARLALYRSNKLPAQIWYVQPNGNEITWNFSSLQINEPATAKYFEQAKPFQLVLPPGWRLEQVKAGP
jgi:TIGR03009 family protein